MKQPLEAQRVSAAICLQAVAHARTHARTEAGSFMESVIDSNSVIPRDQAFFQFFTTHR